jgi:ribosome recycling factor
MLYDFSNIKKRGEEIEEWLKKEFSGLRTGVASPAILDSVFVDSYGSREPIRHVAAINIEDVRTLRIKPWDANLIKEIEKAIINSNLGVAPIADSEGIRISFPEPTGERRLELVKMVSSKLEEARVSVKKERDEVWHDIQEKERKGEISEDDKFRLKDELQKIVDELNRKLEGLASQKEKEIKG